MYPSPSGNKQGRLKNKSKLFDNCRANANVMIATGVNLTKTGTLCVSVNL